MAYAVVVSNTYKGIDNQGISVPIINNERIVEFFINDLADKKISLASIIERHICVGRTDKSKDQPDIILLQLDFLRNRINESNHSAIIINRYKELPDKYQTLLLDEPEKNNVFGVTCNGTFISWVWIKEGKVASFATLNKGGKRTLLTICN